MNMIQHSSKILIISLLLCKSIQGYGLNNESPIPKNAKTIDEVVAIVNENVITNSELVKQTEKVKQQFKSSNEALPPIAELRKQLLNNMILDDLQLQMAKLNNISASSEQVAGALENMSLQNNVDVETLKQMLQRENIDFNDFQQDLRQKLTIMNVQKAAVQHDIQISEQEMQQALNILHNQNAKTQLRISHILISIPSEPTQEKIQFAKNRAEDIVNQLNTGKDFSSVAKIASDGQQASDGGDLGWFSTAELPSIFAEIAPKLAKGEIFGPIQSDNGFHIIKLADRKLDNQKYTEQKYNVRHILIKADEITTDSIAKNELLKLKKEIEKKHNFAELALIYSEDHVSASNGGSLGWITKYLVVPEFANVMDSLKVNQVSAPFKTSYGWHIMQLVDKKVEDSTEKWQKNQAKQIVEQKKFQDALAKWQNKLRSDAHIKVLI